MNDMIMYVKNVLKYLFFLVLIAASLPVYAQKDDKAIVECRLEYPDTVKAGDSVVVTVILNIAPGFIIYAPTEMNRMQDLQVMKLSFTPPVNGIKKSGELLIPQYAQKGPSQIYQGRGVRFCQRFVTGKELKTGVYFLQIKLITQACNDQLCYPPITEVKDAMINVIP